jgi:tetratricopeptide (TPR) repeat protein
MKKNTTFIFIVFMLALAGGCAAPFKIFSKKTIEAQEEKMVEAFLQRGQEYESKGDLEGAWNQYRLALTVNPQSQMANENNNRLKGKLSELAQVHYQKGLQFRKKGQYRMARREFLMTLRFWPDHPEAVKMFSIGKRIRAKRYVVHTIKPGDSLAKLAKLYYGDYKKFSLIAEYNKVLDATQVRAGQEIKIPEIEGIPFFARNREVGVEQVSLPIGELLEQETEEEERGEETVDVVAMYQSHGIDLFNRGQYQEAIVEFAKTLSANPNDAVALEYLYKSHFQQGMVLFSKKDYLAAKEELEASLRYKNDCKKCSEYIKKSLEEYKEIHYTKGISYFREERLVEALREWELVQAIDPHYKSVEQNITKTKNLLRTLEEIQKTQKGKHSK